MNWLEFLATVLAAWAWPVVILTGFWVFRRQLAEVLAKFAGLLDEDVEEASVGASGASIRRKRKDVAEELGRARESLPGPPSSEAKSDARTGERATAFEEEVALLASINPAAAVAAASAALEVALRDVLEHVAKTGQDVGDVGRMTLGRLIPLCERLGLLDRDEAQVARYLSNLRNTAVHEGVATESQALEFADMAMRIAVAARLGAGQTVLDYPEPL